MAIGRIVMAKHLSYDDRLDIEKYLKMELSLSEISRRLNSINLLFQGRYPLDLNLIKRVVMDIVTMHVFIDTIVFLIIFVKKVNAKISINIVGFVAIAMRTVSILGRRFVKN